MAGKTKWRDYIVDGQLQSTQTLFGSIVLTIYRNDRDEVPAQWLCHCSELGVNDVVLTKKHIGNLRREAVELIRKKLRVASRALEKRFPVKGMA